MHLIDQIRKEAAEAIKHALGADAGDLDIAAALVYPEDAANGDLCFPCFPLAKALKKAPPQIAAALAARLQLPASFARAEAKGPYLNLFLEPEALRIAAVAAALEAGESYGHSVAERHEKLMVESVSPNTSKPLHIGHIRNGLIGTALYNLLSSQGHEVVRALIFNDRGLAIAKTMVAYKRWGEGATPESSGMKSDHFVAKWYVMYGQKEKEGVTGLEEEAHESIRLWEAGDAATLKLWQTMNDWCEAGHRETYRKLGFHFDVEHRESEIYKFGKDIVEEGIRRGVLEKDATGAVIARLEKHGLPDKVVLRADGTSLYITQDLYLAKKRVEDYGLDSLIYVVGSEQDLQFQQLFKILELLGYPWATKLTRLGYGYVKLLGGRIKSREGTTADADDLINVLETDASLEIKQRHPTITDDELVRRAHEVATAALKFYFLEVDLTTEMNYDPKASLSFTGKTGPYLQYMHARIRSIIRHAEGEAPKPAYHGRQVASEEKDLALLVAKWPEVVRAAAETRRPSLVAQHLYATAKSFASFYENAQVLNASAEDRAVRLELITAVASMLKNGLKLLDIEAPEEM